jgi:hypothetical protein
MLTAEAEAPWADRAIAIRVRTTPVAPPPTSPEPSVADKVTPR